MKKILIILILILSVFSVANAHPFKSEKELYEYYAEIDKKIFTEKNKPIIRKKYPRKLTDKELEQEQIPFSLKRYTVDEIVGNNKLVYNAFNYQLMSISQINENNKEEGLATMYYESGQKFAIENYKNDLKNGDYYMYYENGNLGMKAFFVNGKREGTIEFYEEDGKKIEKNK